MSLTFEDFPAVFAAIHGVPPFAWQTRLLHTVIEEGWPATIAAPTGTGKTAVLDIALFSLAINPQDAPRRIVFAVDRRVIVDQAHQRANKIGAALLSPKHKLIARMADTLSSIAGGEKPLHVEVLRGGMPREDQWARSPIQPTILSTTVDQLGSRVLFRGYGVSSRSAPIHAGLLGEDALLFLDEAHLSNPFRQTLERLKDRRKQRGQDWGFARRWAFASLTATPANRDDHIFALTDSEQAEPEIAQRLGAAKSAELIEINATFAGGSHAEAFVEAAYLLARRCLHPAPTIAIIVNRVALARTILQTLQQGEHEAILLTGRVRPVERDELIQRYAARLQATNSVEPGAAAKPLFVVATQCIEAGADFDFSALVTQIAPLDALRQRFGRLNRRGIRDQGPAAIITTKGEIARTAEDPLYGKTLRETWEWLASRATQQTTKSARVIEFSPASIADLVNRDAAAARKCVVTARTAPVLRPADVAFFNMTQPKPHPDPNLPLFLHGKVDSEVDVSIIWRADCEMIGEPASDPDTMKENEEIAISVITCMPPRPGEALSVPVWAARAWLDGLGNDAANFSDAEAEATTEPEAGIRRGNRRALRWRGPDDGETKLIASSNLLPGDLIIVPASYGGCDRFGWSPKSADPVPDIADKAARPYAGRYFALRLHPAFFEGEELEVWSAIWHAIRDDVGDLSPEKLLETLIKLSDQLAELRAKLALFQSRPSSPRLEIECPYGADETPIGAVFIARRGIKLSDAVAETAISAVTEDDMAGSYDGSGALLTVHNQAVSDEAAGFAAALGLFSRIAKTLAFAGLHHDDGKADPRFQQSLGREDGGEFLAKSAKWLPRTAMSGARATAGLPPRWRHEVLSVRIVRQILPLIQDDIDPALALYLIGTHHGFGRPMFPHHDTWDEKERRLLDIDIPPHSGPDHLDFDWEGRDWAELSSELQYKYGTWGLAFLEALLRLADHRVSGRAP